MISSPCSHLAAEMLSIKTKQNIELKIEGCNPSPLRLNLLDMHHKREAQCFEEIRNSLILPHWKILEDWAWPPYPIAYMDP